MATFKSKVNVADSGFLTVVGLDFMSDKITKVTIEPIKEVQ